jgi:hypothetical protein
VERMIERRAESQTTDDRREKSEVRGRRSGEKDDRGQMTGDRFRIEERFMAQGTRHTAVKTFFLAP